MSSDSWSRTKRPNQHVYARFGWNAVGSGTLSFEGHCVGRCPISVTNGRARTTDRTHFLLGLDLLFGEGPVVGGFGFWFVPHVTLEQTEIVTTGSSDKNLGLEFTIPLMLGASIPVNDQVKVSLRGFAGPQLLFGGGGGVIERDVDAYEALCRRLSTSGVDRCSTSVEARVGLSPGFAGGALFHIGNQTWANAEAMVQYTNLNLFTFEAADSGWEARQSYGYEGIRVWLLFGIGMGVRGR